MATTSSTTSTPLTSVQGLSSGIQWQDLIDQIVQADTQRELQPLQDKVTAQTTAQSAWSSYGSVISALQSAAQPLASATGFGTFSVSAPNSPSTSRTLLTATASSTATPGTYNVQVQSLAASQQLSGNVVSDATAALGFSGQFIVAGQVITVAASDSLNNVRDKINALNTGSSATHVSASILQSGATDNRLVLSSDLGGAAGIDLRDVRAANTDPSLLTQLGFVSGSTVNIGTDGVARSALFSSSSAGIGSLETGVTSVPAATTISVNGQSVAIDASTQSLSDIVAAINAKAPNTASIETVTSGTTTSYRLAIAGTVAATADAASQPTLDLLGVTRGATGSVQQQVTTANVLQDSSGVTATGTTALAGLKIAGGTGAQSGDTFTITGTKADGTTAVNVTFTVNGTNTVNDLLAQLSTSFSSVDRPVTASIVGGKIQLTDTTGGDSGLSFSVAANNESGASLSFGASSATTVGRQRQLSAGQDARIVVNGIALTRSSNTITDAIAGVTLNLQQAEIGTTIPLAITRDNSKIIASVQAFVSAYNTAKSFVDTNTASGGPLAFNSSVRSSLSTIKNALLSNIPGLPASDSYNNAALMGITFDKTGVLQVDTTALTNVLTTDPSAVQALFTTNGVPSGSNISYVLSGANSTGGAYDIAITQAATRPTVSSSVANFTYAAAGSTDTMTISDSSSGKSGQITLVSGDTPDSVATKLNTLFATQGMRLSALNSAGTLGISGLDYGSAPAFTISYASSGGNDVASMIGIGTTAAPTTIQNGLDVVGTFSDGTNTYAATGAGQLLTGGAGTAVDGLMMKYTGTANSASGHVDFTTGLAGMIANLADSISRTGDGLAVTQSATLQQQIDSLNSRAATVQERLDAERASLTKQFTAMETALAQIQAQGTALTNSINQLSSLNQPSK